MQITRISPFTKTTNVMDINVTQEQIALWESGTLIQVAMPHISADEREFIMTGITPTEWEENFGTSEEEEEEDDGQPSWEQEWEDFGEVYSDEY